MPSLEIDSTVSAVDVVFSVAAADASAGEH